MKKLKLLALLVLFLSLHAFAQDKMYKTNGEVIEVNIIEVGKSTIKYKLYNEPNGPTYTISKDDIKKITNLDVKEIALKKLIANPIIYANQSKNALKVNLLSPLFGFTQINLEHSIKPRRSYELTLGLIGLGKRKQTSTYYFNNNTSEAVYRGAAGIFVGGGYKFLTQFNFLRNYDNYSHVLQGWYAKPEIILGLYRQHDNLSVTNQTLIKNKETVALGAIIFNLGKQWVFSEKFLIDVYGGAGYALDSKPNDESIPFYGTNPTNHFILYSNRYGKGISTTVGLKVGLLLNKKKKQISG